MSRPALIIFRLVNSPSYFFANPGNTRCFFCGQIGKAQSLPSQSSLCDWEGKPSNWTGLLPSVDMVSQGLAFASPFMLHFKNPQNFLAGNLTTCLPHWEIVLKDYPRATEIFCYVYECIKKQDFFVSFCGTFRI